MTAFRVRKPKKREPRLPVRDLRLDAGSKISAVAV